jgi:FO synthase subunit 1
VAKSFISKGKHQTPVKLIADCAGLQNRAPDVCIDRSSAGELFAECNTADLVRLAGKIRDKTMPGGIVTYSRKVFINLINLCRDSCSYCTYKKEPGDPMAWLMNPSQVLAIAEAGKKFHCTEALFVTGERPEQKYSQASDWLHSLGHSTTIEYISEMCDVVR